MHCHTKIIALVCCIGLFVAFVCLLHSCFATFIHFEGRITVGNCGVGLCENRKVAELWMTCGASLRKELLSEL